MNTQKQVTITELKGKFNKDFDSFGKLEAFLQFSVGKCLARTQISAGSGKQPSWKDSVVLTYFDEAQIVVKAYDGDGTQKQFIGSGKLEIKSLRFPGGSIELAILTDNGQAIGTITGKYTMKNLTQSPLLLLKNLRLELRTQQKNILKSRPYLQFSTDQNSIATEPKDEIKGLSVSWSENLRLKIKQSSKIAISLIDKDNAENYLFRYQCFTKQFRLQAGTKRFNILSKKFEKFAVLHIDYETVNLVSKEESVKNLERQKKAQNELTAIMIERISAQLKVQDKDVYFKLIVGTNSYATELFKKNQKLFTIQTKKTLYAEDRQNKLIIVLFSKDLISDSILVYGHISLESLLNGDKKIALLNQQKQDMGSVTLALSLKNIPCKTLNLQSLQLNINEDSDVIGQSQPFLVAKIGNCSGSTQVGDSGKLTFKRGIQLKYFDEQVLELEIWDEDGAKNELLFSEKVKLNELKGNKGQQPIVFSVSKEGKVQPKAKLIFKYQLKSSASQVPRKNTERKNEPQSPKKEATVQNTKEKRKSIELSQSVKPGAQTHRSESIQQKAAKKEQTSPLQKLHQTQQNKQQIVIINNYKTEQKQVTQRAHDTIQRSEQPQSSRQDKKSIKNQSLSINKSRESLILPSIITSSKFYGDKIFDKQSAATLQKSILAYSMPKATRFSNEPKYSGEPAYCMDSCFKPNPSKGVGFGFGGKKQFPQWMERNMKENPPPGAYFDDRHNINSKGPTFGLSHKYYQKVIIPKEQKSTVGAVQTVRKLSPIRDPAK